jgi:hypothetical protein
MADEPDLWRSQVDKIHFCVSVTDKRAPLDCKEVHASTILPFWMELFLTREMVALEISM